MRNKTLIPKLPKIGQRFIYGTRHSGRLNASGFSICYAADFYYAGQQDGCIIGVHPKHGILYINMQYPDHDLKLTTKSADYITAARRKDGYYMVGMIVGKKLAIIAGCRFFTTIDAAKEHWNNRQRAAWAYDRFGKTWNGREYVSQYNHSRARNRRKRDKDLNTFSLAFVRKVARHLPKR